MYTDVSQSFVNMMSSNAGVLQARIVIGEQTIENNHIHSVSCESASCPDVVSMGNLILPKLTFTTNANVTIPENGEKATFYIGLSETGADFEFVPVRSMLVSKVTKSGEKYTFETKSKFEEVDKVYSSVLTYPVSSLAVLDEIKTQLGIEIDTSGIVDFTIETLPEGFTYREVICSIAERSGKNCFVSRDDTTLIFKWFENGADISPDCCDEPEFSTGITSYNGVSCIKDAKLITSGSAPYFNVNNTLGVMSEEAHLSAVMENLEGFSFTPGKINMLLGNIILDPWDLITYEDKTIPVCNLVHNYDGGLTTEITVPDVDESLSDGTKPAQTTQDRAMERLTMDVIAAKELIANKASVEDLNAVKSKIEELNANKATIADLEVTNSFISRVESTANEALDSVNNLEVGGRNLLLGTTNSWTEATWGSYSYPLRTGVALESIGLYPGNIITFALDIKTENNLNLCARLIISSNTSMTDRLCDISSYTRINNGIGRSAITCTIPENGAYIWLYLGRLANLTDTTSHTEYYKALKLEKGNKPTDWTPAPEDVDKQFQNYSTTVEMNSAIEQKANSIMTTVSETFDPTLSRNGSIIAVTDSAELPLVGLTLHGNTTQGGTTGKNLLENQLTSETVNGLTISVNTDGSITVNGTSTASFSRALNNNITLSAGKYTISGGKETNARLEFRANKSDGSTIALSDTGKGATVTITEDVTSSNLIVVFISGTTFSNYTFYPMIRL
ncbi:MAG: hypothetical protein IJX42_00950, partial [Oscillospiraceae bacterium]|nr:hypothetical protein [Oscillospiraceae bacterium]